MAYAKLKQILEQKGTEFVARSLNLPEKTLKLKLDETIDMSIKEAQMIQRLWAEEYTLDDLFESDGNVPSKAESLHAQAEVAYEAALASEEISAAEAEELRGLLHECADTACEKKRQSIKA